MILGLDVDGTITDNAEFFETLTHLWPWKVHIVTYRKNDGSTEKLLKKLNISYNEVHYVTSLDSKVNVIKEQNIKIYFDDQDECLYNIPEDVTIFKIRNGGNFDFKKQKWLYSSLTGLDINNRQTRL